MKRRKVWVLVKRGKMRFLHIGGPVAFTIKNVAEWFKHDGEMVVPMLLVPVKKTTKKRGKNG